ncbi:MAG: DUF4143 domain-containing protein, partial [Angustibacter sp.]
LIHSLPAWGASQTQRVIGRPKVSLLDSGLAARLAHLSPEALALGGRGARQLGPLLESFVAGELRRQGSWTEHPFHIFHFRSRRGVEVDLVLEDPAGTVVGIEVKASSTVRAHDFAGLKFLRDKRDSNFAMGVVLHTGPDPIRFGERLWALPVGALWQ